MVKAAADKYAAEKKLTRRTPEDCQSERRSRSSLRLTSTAPAPSPPAEREGCSSSPSERSGPERFDASAIEERHEHIQHPAERQRHRGHLQPRDPRAQGRVAAGARGQGRGAARRQRRGQDDHAARRQQPAARRARRGDQGLDRTARRAHRDAVDLRDGQARRDPGDGRPPLLRPPDDRGQPDDRRLHAPGRQGRGRRRRWRRSTPTSRA